MFNSVYRKTTFTGLFTNFESFLPAACLQERFHFLSLVSLIQLTSATHIKVFTLNLKNWKSCVLQNGCPKFAMNSCIKTFLDKTISPPPKIQTLTVSKLLIPMFYHFRRSYAIKIRQQLHKLFSSAYPMYNYVRISNQYADCLIFTIAKIVFFLIWDLMSCINLSVNAVMHCIWANHADIYIRIDIWVLWNLGFAIDWQISFVCFKIKYFRSF
jgi:hypothetical protein